MLKLKPKPAPKPAAILTAAKKSASAFGKAFAAKAAKNG